MDDLFESTRRLVSAKAPEERRGIPRIEVVREALRGNGEFLPHYNTCSKHFPTLQMINMARG